MDIERIEAKLRDACKGKKVSCGTFDACPVGHLINTVSNLNTLDPILSATKILDISIDQAWALVWGFDGKDICQSTDCEPFRDLGMKLRKELL